MQTVVALRLAELCDAPQAHFIHKVSGISLNLKRQTGKLENCPVPVSRDDPPPPPETDQRSGRCFRGGSDPRSACQAPR